MSSETITRNDLTAILNEVLPIKPSEYKKLLWTNPSPSSGFAAQTISLDLSEYDDVEIECLAAAGGVDSVIERCAVGKDIMAQYLSGGNGYGSGTTFLAERKFKTSTSGVEALNGLGNFADSSSWAYNSTSRMIPYRIYGIKYEQVLPPAMDALEWKLKGTATNNNTVSMPSDYNEVLLWGSYSTVYFSAVVPKQEISNTGTYPRCAFYYNASTNEAVTFKVTSTEAKIEAWYYNSGNARTSGLTFKLYYR